MYVTVNLHSGKEHTTYLNSENEAKLIIDKLTLTDKDSNFVSIGDSVYKVNDIESVQYGRVKCFNTLDRVRYKEDRYSRIHYVLGIIFTESGKVLLQLKNRGNSYINGKLNGVGGKEEKGETSYEAMVREFKEETGWHNKVNWKPMMALEYDNCVINVYHTIIKDRKFETFKFTSDDDNAEELVFVNLEDLPNYLDKMANNLGYIIGICWDDIQNG